MKMLKRCSVMLLICFYVMTLIPFSSVEAAEAPAAPTIKSLTMGLEDVLTIKWSKVNGADGYRVYRKCTGDSKYKSIKTITKGTTVSYKDTTWSGEPGEKVSYIVRSYVLNKDGTKVFSANSKAKKYTVTGKEWKHLQKYLVKNGYDDVAYYSDLSPDDDFISADYTDLYPYTDIPYEQGHYEFNETEYYSNYRKSPASGHVWADTTNGCCKVVSFEFNERPYFAGEIKTYTIAEENLPKTWYHAGKNGGTTNDGTGTNINPHITWRDANEDFLYLSSSNLWPGDHVFIPGLEQELDYDLSNGREMVEWVLQSLKVKLYIPENLRFKNSHYDLANYMATIAYGYDYFQLEYHIEIEYYFTSVDIVEVANNRGKAVKLADINFVGWEPTKSAIMDGYGIECEGIEVFLDEHHLDEPRTVLSTDGKTLTYVDDGTFIGQVLEFSTKEIIDSDNWIPAEYLANGHPYSYRQQRLRDCSYDFLFDNINVHSEILWRECANETLYGDHQYDIVYDSKYKRYFDEYYEDSIYALWR